MKTDLLDYDLPKERIAQNPPKERGTTNLLVLDKETGDIEHKKYFDIPSYVKKGDVVVLNSTKVIWARIFPAVERTGKIVELLFLDQIKKDKWHCLIGRAKNVKIGDILKLEEYKLKIVKREKGDPGFIIEVQNADKLMKKYGHVPLPPYIKRKDRKEDRIRYNTVFAEESGSVAAPTASLNLTDSLINKIEKAGAKVCYVDLRVGWGTFAPINTENVEDFHIHGEYVEIGKETAEAVNNCNGKVWAFGTTVVRSLESAAIGKREINEFKGITDLFIYPGYDFKIVDVLVTNFHSPRTSLLALVSAFAGEEKVMNAYSEAKNKKYMFLSYGDSMLIT
jgi:S-adenosylmethionine:tRNA ribosyltransferase-isomerase